MTTTNQLRRDREEAKLAVFSFTESLSDVYANHSHMDKARSALSSWCRPI